jgi:hypothetical protein
VNLFFGLTAAREAYAAAPRFVLILFEVLPARFCLVVISVAFFDVCCFCAMASVFSLVLLLVASAGAGV